MRSLVQLGSVLVQCDVASSPTELTTGLSSHSNLREGEGMLFKFASPRSVTMFMSTVRYNIDIVFIDPAERVARIVHNAQPGSRETWTHSPTALVVEVPGGFCWRHSIKVGDDVETGGSVRRSALEGYSANPERTEPGDHGPMNSDRFKDRGLPDESDPNAVDGPMPNWSETLGFDVTNPDFSDENAPSLFRPSAGVTIVRRAQNAAELPSGEIVDPAQFALGAIKALSEAARAGDGLQWKDDPLSAGREQYAIVTKDTVKDWLRHVGIHDIPSIEDAAVSASGMGNIAQSLVIANVATRTRFTPDGQALILYRDAGAES